MKMVLMKNDELRNGNSPFCLLKTIQPYHSKSCKFLRLGNRSAEDHLACRAERSVSRHLRTISVVHERRHKSVDGMRKTANFGCPDGPCKQKRRESPKK